MGTTWNEIPGVGYWKWWAPFAKQIGGQQMGLWRGTIQPWETPAGRQLEGAARRATELGREQLLESGDILNQTPGLLRRLSGEMGQAGTQSYLQGLNQLRAAEHPANFVMGQQKLGQGLIGLGLQLKQLQTMQDQANQSGFDLGGLLGGIGSIAGMALGGPLGGSLGLGSLGSNMGLLSDLAKMGASPLTLLANSGLPGSQMLGILPYFMA